MDHLFFFCSVLLTSHICFFLEILQIPLICPNCNYAWCVLYLRNINMNACSLCQTVPAPCICLLAPPKLRQALIFFSSLPLFQNVNCLGRVLQRPSLPSTKRAPTVKFSAVLLLLHSSPDTWLKLGFSLRGSRLLLSDQHQHFSLLLQQITRMTQRCESNLSLGPGPHVHF